MSDSGLEFPPFVPAKPKGDMVTQPQKAVDIVGKPKRQKKTAGVFVAEAMEANQLGAAGLGEKKRRKKRKPRPATVPLDAIVGFAGLSTEEAEQVVNFCEALQTFPKGSRARIVQALGKIFG